MMKYLLRLGDSQAVALQKPLGLTVVATFCPAADNLRCSCRPDAFAPLQHPRRARLVQDLQRLKMAPKTAGCIEPYDDTRAMSVQAQEGRIPGRQDA